jgi:TDG/mug DNA glycosylase family protein
MKSRVPGPRRAKRLRPLVDVVCPSPRVLLVGINPGLRSGLTPVLLAPSEDRRLAEFGIALTNLCPRPTRSAAELTPEEIAAGRRSLARKCARLRPRAVAFVGLSLYQWYFRLPRSGGPGPKPELIAAAPVFVVPNPSGLNASFPGFQHKLPWYEALAKFVAEREVAAR